MKLSVLNRHRGHRRRPDWHFPTIQHSHLLFVLVNCRLRKRVEGEQQQRAAAVPRFTAEILPYFADGRLRPAIDRVVEFHELAAAKECMESGAHVGKIVLRVTPQRN